MKPGDEDPPQCVRGETLDDVIMALQELRDRLGRNVPFRLVECYDEPDAYCITDIYELDGMAVVELALTE